MKIARISNPGLLIFFIIYCITKRLFNFDTNFKNIASGTFKKKLRECFSKYLKNPYTEMLITCCTHKGDESLGLPGMHEYSILQLATVMSNGTTIRLVNVRNPHGNDSQVCLRTLNSRLRGLN